MANNNLTVIDGEALADMRLPPARYCVKSLLHQGVTILGGAPKIGKSWLVLDLCVWVAKRESVFGLEVRRGTTLYLCLEDTLRRLQHRLGSLTDEAPANMFFSTEARTLTDGLCDQVREFVRAHPDTVLVAVDTFQVIRSTTPDVSYATDYQDVRELKKLADELGLSILLVHHLRKQGAADPLNKLSGTTGIAGAVDAVLVLEKSDRCQSGAVLICTVRDIEYRELELRFDSGACSWELVSDSAEDPAMLLPPELGDLVDFMKTEGCFSGSNTEHAERYNAHAGRDLSERKPGERKLPWAIRQMTTRTSNQHGHNKCTKEVKKMASIVQKSKRKYKITVSNGYRADGRKISKAKTITVPDSVPRRGIEQYVIHAAEEMEREVKNGYSEDCETPFQKYAAHWPSRQVKYAPSTRASYDRMLQRVYPYIGAVKVKDIRPIALENMLTELRKQTRGGKPIQEATVQKYLTVVSAVLSDAKRNEIIQKNPARRTMRPQVVGLHHGRRPLYSYRQPLPQHRGRGGGEGGPH